MENQGGNKVKRTLTPEQKRRILEKRRKARMKKRLMIIVPIAAVALAAIIVLAVVLGGGNDEKGSQTQAINTPEPIMAQDAAVDEVGADGSEQPGAAVPLNADDGEGLAVPNGSADGVDSLSAGATAAPNVPVQPAASGFDYDTEYKKATQGMTTGPELVYDYYAEIDPAKLTRWTEAKEGYMPVLFKANTDEKIIAVTVDDCFQGNNLMQIIQCAEQNNADLTIFPIGDNLDVDTVATALRYAYETGHEIGNHTYNHAGMYHYEQERMEQEIWYQQMKVNETLGVNYTQHFFRPKGGDEREDQRVHAYLNQLGYDGVAIWSQSGSTDSLDSLFNNLAPGKIYLFHTTNNDLNKLLKFIPGAVERGYRLVTLSEMFGLPENEIGELTLTTATQPPKLQAFNIKVPTLKKTSYIRAAAVVQERLIELGWLEGEADGVYGQSSFIAVGLCQMEAGMKPNGAANAETQALLFSGEAPVGTEEKIAALYKQLGKSAPQ